MQPEKERHVDADDDDRRVSLVRALLSYMAPMDPLTTLPRHRALCGVLNVFCSGKRCDDETLGAAVGYETMKGQCDTVKAHIENTQQPPWSIQLPFRERSLVRLYKGIGDDDMKNFSVLVASGALASLRVLDLRLNQIGDVGLSALADAIGTSGALASLTILDLKGNKISDEGMKAFSSALSSGALGSLQTLGLYGNRIGDVGMQSFASAVASGALPNVQNVYLTGNPGNGAPVEKALAERRK